MAALTAASASYYPGMKVIRFSSVNDGDTFTVNPPKSVWAQNVTNQSTQTSASVNLVQSTTTVTLYPAVDGDAVNLFIPN